jgi:serine/threonine protein kinase
MDERELEVQTNEVELLRACEHQNIVRLIDYFEDPLNMYLVLEYLEGSNLLKYVAKKEILKEPLCRKVMKQIFEGLSYLHDIGIVHRDIKLDNIMMTVQN